MSSELDMASDIQTGRASVRFEGAEIPVYVARAASAPSVSSSSTSASSASSTSSSSSSVLTVMVYGAIWSITPHIEDLCNRLAREGFNAIAPCLFRNTGIPARSAPPEVLAQTFLDFDDRRCIRDLRAVTHAARRGHLGFEPGRLVTLGFCLGGRFAHDIAALDSTLAGAVVFYGRLRFARQETKPFLPAELTGLVEVPYLGHFAEFDSMIPLDDVEELRGALASRNVPHRIEIYKGARHGFVDPERPTEHDPGAAARAWHTTIEFLKGLA